MYSFRLLCRLSYGGWRDCADSPVDSCGHESHIFGKDGGSDVSGNWDVPLIAQVPLAMEIREKMDSGESVVKGNSSGYSDDCFRKAARFIAASLWSKKPASPEISLVED